MMVQVIAGDERYSGATLIVLFVMRRGHAMDV